MDATPPGSRTSRQGSLGHPLGRAGEAVEIAGAVVCLLSAEASYVTGGNLRIVVNLVGPGLRHMSVGWGAHQEAPDAFVVMPRLENDRAERPRPNT